MSGWSPSEQVRALTRGLPIKLFSYWKKTKLLQRRGSVVWPEPSLRTLDILISFPWLHVHSLSHLDMFVYAFCTPPAGVGHFICIYPLGATRPQSPLYFLLWTCSRMIFTTHVFSFLIGYSLMFHPLLLSYITTLWLLPVSLVTHQSVTVCILPCKIILF